LKTTETGLFPEEKRKDRNEKINIILLEDEQIVNNLHRYLDLGKLQLKSIVKTNALHSFFEVILKEKPNIVVFHIVLPEIDWVGLIIGIKDLNPNIKIIACSSYIERRFILKVMGAGAAGYVVDRKKPEDLSLALEVVSKQGIFLSSELLADSSESQKIPMAVNNDISLLSERECEVVRLIGEGLSTKEIAFDLVISSKTVETYRKRIMEKLDIYSIAGLIKFTISTGLTNV
jgi:DNA-binding NarL/FixJ family response regulator